MLEQDFGSDTDDSDYAPQGEGHEASEEEGSGLDENTIHGEDTDKKSAQKKKKKLKKKSNSLFSRTPAEDTSKDWQKFDEEVKKELNEEKEQERINSLWSAFKTDVDVKTTKPKPSLCDNKDNKTTTEIKSSASSSSSIASAKPSSSSNRFGSLFDPSPAPEATKCDSTANASTTSKSKSRFGSLFDDDHKKDHSEAEPSDKNNTETKSGDKISVTKVYDFAGEVVKVTKEVAADSKEAKQFLEKSAEEQASNEAAAKRKVGGLASVVGSIGKKAKMGCLDKSQIDWNQYIAEEGIKEELSTHNRGKEGFVEKQMFLERADHRQFEIERSIREKNRKTLMK